MLKNKKAMLGNLIGGFVCILVMCSLIPVVAQQILGAMGCDNTNQVSTPSTSEVQMVYDDSATGSFGGAGAAHFGGYDGTVKRSWVRQVVQNTASIYPWQQGSVQCGGAGSSNVTSSSTELIGTMANIVPLFFALAIAGCAIAIVASSLRNAGAL